MSKKTAKKKKSRPALRISPGTIIAGVLLLCVGGCVAVIALSWNKIRTQARIGMMASQWEQKNGAKPFRIVDIPPEQGWETFTDPSGRISFELKGIVVEGQTSPNNIATREFFAQDANQVFTVTLYTLPAKRLENLEELRSGQRSDRNTLVNLSQQSDIQWLDNVCVDSVGKYRANNWSVHARDVVVGNQWLQVEVHGVNGPYNESDAERFFNSFKIKQ